ncbi:MAG: periplasmic heavy metal sensor [Elusimicrobia bacterium]|nr:periplasmic heavy metal sensor [Elusimicrobiota bacterium]
MLKKYSGVMVLFLLAGTLATAKGPGEWHDREGMREEMKTELGLTDEQEMKLETHRIDQRAAMEKLWLAVKQKREALKIALEKPNLDKGEVRKLNERLKDTQNDLADQRLEGILYVRSVLNPEQFQKFLTLRPDPRKRNNKEGKRHGNRDDKSESRRGDRPRRSEYKSDRPDAPPNAMDEDPMEPPH